MDVFQMNKINNCSKKTPIKDATNFEFHSCRINTFYRLIRVYKQKKYFNEEAPPPQAFVSYADNWSEAYIPTQTQSK